MSRVRLAAAAVTVACGLMLVGGTGVASAKDAARLTQVVPLTGTVKGGKALAGAAKTGKLKAKFTIKRFVAQGGKLYAVGTVKGMVGGKKVYEEKVKLPAAIANATAGTARASQAPLPPLPPGPSCSILSLNLGPINLNLLGLVVRTNEIQVRIDAVRGPNNLLGNLLCGLTGILNPTTLASTPLGQVAAILNALLVLSPATGTA